jgi:hypothetical protein
LGYADRGIPSESSQRRTGILYLRVANQQSESPPKSNQTGAYSKRNGEPFDGAESHHIEGGRRNGFGADVLYIDARHCERSGHFAQESDFLMVGLDESEDNARGPYLYR